MRNTRGTYIIIMLMSVFMHTQAQHFKAYKNTVSNGYNFWISTPHDYDSARNDYPLILFIHGNSLCGSDLNRVLRYGVLDAMEKGRKINALVLAPQNPGGAWQATKLHNLICWVREHYAFDTNRIYVIGMSLGGYGTLDFVGTHPEYIAAAMALCGGSTLKDYSKLSQVPLWIIHGTGDKAVSVTQSQKVVDQMKALGETPLLRFDKLNGAGHSHLARVFYVDETYQWLLAHSLADSIRKVDTTVKITMNTLAAAYQNIDRNANHITIEYGTNTLSSDSTQNINDSITDTTTDTPSCHYVKKGDTLSAIARRYHTTVSRLCQINHINENAILQIGQKIKLK